MTWKLPESRWICAATVLVCLLGLPLAGSAATPQLIGSEVQVNTNGLSQLHNPSAAFDASGRSLVVWENDLLGVRGRLYDSAGKPLGNELALVGNVAWSVLPGIAPVVFHRNPAIVFLPSGNFLLAWAEEHGTLEWTIFFENLQVQSREIVVQEFNAAGTPVTGQRTISSGGVGLKSLPRLAALPAGGVAAAWMSSYGKGSTPASELGVFTRQLDGNGRPIGAQTQVDTKKGAIGLTPALAVDPDGSYLIAWTSQNGTDTFNTSIYGRVFGASGAPLAVPFAITSSTVVGPQGRPTVANDGRGSYLVAWQSYFNDAFHTRVDGQIVSKAGGLLGKLQTISTGEGNNLADAAPSAAVAPGGTFMLTWMEWNISFPVGLAGVQVDRTGVPLGNQFWINDLQIGAQSRTSLATDGAGHYLSSYEGFENQTTVGIRARYFAAD
jgi:hypothetical protein